MLPIRRIYPATSVLDILDDFFTNPFEDTSIRCPIHDVIENEQEFIVEAMLVGVKKEDVVVDVNARRLSIEAVRKETKDTNYNRKESFTGTYKRSFTLPDNADADGITANMEDGVLTVKIPKLDKPKETKKKIEIK